MTEKLRKNTSLVWSLLLVLTGFFALFLMKKVEVQAEKTLPFSPLVETTEQSLEAGQSGRIEHLTSNR